MVINFTDITYLKHGSAAQQEVYTLLTEWQVMDMLKHYSPVPVGTFPLDIQVPGSDLDIVCCYTDADSFAAEMKALFVAEDGFSIKEISHLAEPAVLVSFIKSGLPVEIFGQAIPVIEQMGYRHMLAEYAILQHFGEEFKQAVIGLKLQGIKTEPAFCQLLGLGGDPYLNLLEYKLPT
ncbi:DUF4269 domain-containing protein [Mucilaginibacter pedocola]|uniref:Diadenosine tetraphosphate hydrolase n=1 Tax=Mucilaginibacter pedocola TaxID=1792845 RepID=A0A1S9P9S6_9SPHI|nr:DUF4269 domain-containing protein [Mucilaginibacter pedocola]OOQ57701.1 hypothetical protein BC343_12955 [Mucilaginibacter pedocola]